MVVYIFMDGNVKIVSPENVYQGSNVTEITLLAPFPDETSVSVGFELPDGTVPDKQPMSYTQTIIDGQSVRAYVYKLPYAVTQEAGNVKMSFIAKFTNGQQTSYMANFEVQESVLPTPPENPDQNTYDLLLQYYQDAKNSAIAAQDAAEKAQEAALDANDTANTAEEKAESAVDTASHALETAQAAESKSDSAVSTAEDANKKSDNAVSTASAAATTATAAMSTAISAVSTANSAESKSDSAVSTANDANQTAEKAFSAASSAQKVADAASDTASSAQSVAEGIDGKASQALTVSQQAFDTAENAQTVAEGIDGKASEALTNSEQAVSTANEAKKLAEQAVEGNGTEVYVDNALQPRVDFTSDPQTQINDIVRGKQVVGKATDADNVKSQINGKAISSIFESDGTTAKKATRATQDADGNVINTTYAKLSQVVRKDVLVGAINPTSDAGKNWLANKQVLTSGAIISASGWYRIALIPNYCKVKFNIFKQYNYDVGTATTITINSGIASRNYVLINVENSLVGDTSDNYVKQVCFSDVSAKASGYVDVYIEAGENESNAYWLAVDVEKVYNTNFEIYAFESVTEAVADNAIIVDVPQSGGSNTNKPIYQQGKPVLVGDKSAIFESDGTTVKKASKLANPRALPVNLALSSGNASKFDGSADTSLGVTGTLPVANGGTGESNLDNVTVGNAKKATQDANGKPISSTYATKAEATRAATYTQQGQVKMGSTTNGGNITDADSDDVVPTIKNICDWTKGNFFSSDAPQWTSNTSGGLTLPSEGWYCINYAGKISVMVTPTFSTGVFYWDGYAICLPVSIFLYNSTVTTRAVRISADGVIIVFDPNTGESKTDFTVAYYKLA